METTPWMSGNDANAQSGQGAGANAVINMATAIFGQIGANRYAQNTYFKPSDVVVPETARDNRALIAAGGTVILALIVLILMAR
jgi:hypothetical protein